VPGQQNDFGFAVAGKSLKSETFDDLPADHGSRHRADRKRYDIKEMRRPFGKNQREATKAQWRCSSHIFSAAQATALCSGVSPASKSKPYFFSM
jgi:hypothetical protein